MEKIDLKDRKILYELDLNCRQSNTQIGKKVGLSKDLVSYRINRLQEKGIITGFWTAINTYKLGYYVFRIYINLIDVSAKTKKEIIQYFVKNEDAWAVLTAKGPVDLDVVLWVNDVYKFNQYWVNTLQKYGKYFSKSTISILTDTISCKKSFLLDRDKELSERRHDLAVTNLILGFLLSKDGANFLDFDYLFNLMFSIMKKRYGYELNKVVDSNGKVICECKYPLLSTNFSEQELNDDKVRDRLAACLLPLVKDRFVPSSEYAFNKLMKTLQEMNETLFRKALEQ